LIEPLGNEAKGGFMIRSMTALLLAVTLSAGIQAQAATANQETYYYSLGEPTITEIPDYGAMVPIAGLVQDCDKNISYNTTFSDEVQTAPAGVVDKVGTVVVVLDQVINIGKKVFDVIIMNDGSMDYINNIILKL
jgi:hypothetical protein